MVDKLFAQPIGNEVLCDLHPEMMNLPWRIVRCLDMGLIGLVRDIDMLANTQDLTGATAMPIEVDGQTIGVEIFYEDFILRYEYDPENCLPNDQNGNSELGIVCSVYYDGDIYWLMEESNIHVLEDFIYRANMAFAEMYGKVRA